TQPGAVRGTLLASIADDLRSGSDAQPDAATELAAVVDAFALIDVEVRLRGALPADPACALAFARAVREAATNAVSHAQAAVVEAVFARIGGMETCTVCNDGAPCAAPPREGGGLTGMRASATALGGVLEVDPGPPFTVRMRVPCAQAVGEPIFCSWSGQFGPCDLRERPLSP
ncbi:MAG: sensor histidine kinase, partial [Parafannyhessea sp.]|uniref:sensor histidine kinase n=1 Tax=Parafannyhessea sp. TaxID=2847324 RepID=UPI003F0BCDB3